MSGAGSPRSLPTPAAGGPRRPSRLVLRLAGDHVEERVYRALAFAFLPGGVLFGLLAAPSIAAQLDSWPRWWTICAAVVGIVPSIALGLTAFALPVARLRLLARINVIGTLVVLASVPFAEIPSAPPAGPIWFSQICGLGIISSTLATVPSLAALTAVAGGVLNLVDRVALGGPDAWLLGSQNALYILLFSITFIALGVSSIIAGAAADAAEADAETATATAAADAARERERARINALVHDRVLATLLAAAHRIPGSGPLGRADAERALTGLRGLLTDDALAADLPGERFVWTVQAATTESIPEAVFNYELLAHLVVPGAVVDALLEVTEEAIRNSRLHAGAANRTVHVRIDDGGVTVDVLDDGVGFVRSAVPAARLGIAESIEGRMRSVSGGSAQVISQPGVGTRVSVRWRAS